jgi:uncharacterized protein YcaQ
VGVTLAALRDHAVARSLREHGSLGDAIAALGFVQADPIRAPARAQDLILRPRVSGYRVGDLDAAYADLDLDEEMLQVHGFLPRADARLIRPRTLGPHWTEFLERHAALERPVLRFLRQQGPAHARDVERAVATAVGSLAVVNAWGGTSSATTVMLEALHRVGSVRIAGREGGKRVYALAPPRGRAIAPTARGEGLARLLTKLYAPTPERSLRATLARLRAPPEASPVAGLARLVARGELRREIVDGEAWIWPAEESVALGAEDRVRLLAPFDPVVWDRRRFALFWGWEYRFEAYTPIAKRKLGYYALPVLFRSRVVGWANVGARADGSKASDTVDVELGFVAKPRERVFARELDREIELVRAFLTPRRAAT